jgi:hypothetical protein
MGVAMGVRVGPSGTPLPTGEEPPDLSEEDLLEP